MSSELTKNTSNAYGVLLRDRPESEVDEVVDQLTRLGFAILDSGYTADQLTEISVAFNRVRDNYQARYGRSRLRSLSELHTIRGLLAHNERIFISLAKNASLLNVLERLIFGKFILNQQNGIVNPPRETYNQAAWHRDLPYQHYVSSTPLAVNALFCVDDFTQDNGATIILPATHKFPTFPSREYIHRNAIQLEAKAGQFILLDCMLFHRGGFNSTEFERRGINHVYTIPYFKQQISLPSMLQDLVLGPAERELFGFDFEEPRSIEEFLARRVSKY